MTIASMQIRPLAPALVLHMERGRILNVADLPNTPVWAKPIVAAAVKLNVG